MSTDLSPDSLPPKVAARVEAELQPGEKLVWLGQPSPWRGFVASLFVAGIGLFFVGFALVWFLLTGGLALLTGAAAGNQPEAGALPAAFLGCFSLCALPFVLVGALLLGAPLWSRYAAKRTCYAITDRRAILWEPRAFGAWQVRSYGPGSLRELSRVERADGWGDLILDEYQTRDSDGGRHITRRGFFGIPNVHEVERLLRQTLIEPRPQ
jgi:hypothetical protein